MNIIYPTAKILALALGTTLVFLSLLLFAYLIPNHWVQPHIKQSMILLESEGSYKKILDKNHAVQLDNYSDKIMFEAADRRPSLNLLHAALAPAARPRFWHGYLVILRPLLIFFNYEQIRYLNVFFILILFGTVFSQLAKRFHWLVPVGFVASMAMSHVYIFPLSLEFTNAFAVTMISMLALFHLHDHAAELEHNDIYLFFLIGAAINYFDFFVIPLWSLGFSLVVYLLLVQNDEGRTFWKNLILIAKNSAFWLTGYALVWIAKWTLGQFILKTNLLSFVFQHATCRLRGDATLPLDRTYMFARNLDMMFPSYFWKIGLVFLCAFILLLSLRHKPWRETVKHLPILGIIASPYAWYFVVASHSQIHFWFTLQLFDLFLHPSRPHRVFIPLFSQDVDSFGPADCFLLCHIPLTGQGLDSFRMSGQLSASPHPVDGLILRCAPSCRSRFCFATSR